MSQTPALVDQYLDHGLRVVPIRADGTKFPSLSEWTPYRDPAHPYDAARVRGEWFPAGREWGVGLILGDTAGGLFAIDCEYLDFAEEVLHIVGHLMPELSGRIPQHRTPGKALDGGGRHLFFRHAGAKTEPLARLTPGEALSRTGDAKKVIAVEVHAHGKQVLVPGGCVSQHPSGIAYECLTPDCMVWDAPELSAEQYESLISICRCLSRQEVAESGQRYNESRAKQKAVATDGGGSGSWPGDAFNARASIADLVSGHFALVYERGGVSYYRRAGKDRGLSASLGYAKSEDGRPLFYCFSTNAAPFDVGRTYDALGVYALLNYGGDFSAACKELYASGFGDRLSPAVVPGGGGLSGGPSADPSGASGVLEEEPIDPDANVVEVLDFPLVVFPRRIMDYCKTVSEAKSAPVDYVGALVLAVASSAIGATRKLCPKPDHQEMANIYLSIVGRPGRGKSPCFFEVSRPLLTEAKRLEEAYNAELTQYLEAVEQSGGHGPVGVRKPSLRQLHVEDFTVESLIPILNENPRGVAVPQDELTRFLASFNQYGTNSAKTDIGFYLSAWNGRAYKKNRRTGNERMLTGDVFLTIFGGIQPDKLDDIIGWERGRDGFADRFLFVFPEQRERPVYDFEKTVDVVSQQVWDDVYRSLLAFDWEVAEDESGNEVSRASEVTLSEGAKRAFLEWATPHTGEINSKELDPMLDEPWQKYETHTFRLALILHCLRCVEGEIPEHRQGEIDERTMVAATVLAEYFKSHARKVYKTSQFNPKDQAEMRIYKWMTRQPADKYPDGFKARDLQRVNLVKKASDARKVFVSLADRGWGRFDLGKGIFTLYGKTEEQS